MNPLRTFPLAGLIFITGCSLGQQENTEITRQELKEHVSYLASEQLKGRYPGTPGDQKAAGYIAGNLKKAGLTLSDGSGMQMFRVVTGQKPGRNNHLSFDGFRGLLNKDFVPMPFSGSDALDAPLVFLGYGFQVEANGFQWDDYTGTDIEGKWVMMLRGIPDNDKLKKYFMGQRSDREKALTAKDKGAGGILFVSPGKNGSKDELVNPGIRKGNIEIPALHIKREMADKLLKLSSKPSIDEITASIDETEKSESFQLDKEIHGSTELIPLEGETQNVIATLKGGASSSSERYIVIGGHYDHLGMGGENTGSRRPDTMAIHYGADDNASGIAAMMEIAEKLASVKDSLSTNFLFAGFGAEEMGLIGSKYFVSNSTVPLKNIMGMINLDMIGRLRADNSLQVGGVGTSLEADSILRQLNASYDFTLGLSPEGYGPSDHSSFYSKDIPVFFFSTGPHLDYHTPEDTPDKINYEGLKLVSDYVCDLALHLSKRKKELTFQEAGPKMEDQQQRRAELKVTLGIMPDFAGVVKKGLQADLVIKGKPAYRAGMKDGDIITAINGKHVGDIYDYMDRLSEIEPGQTITVEILRNGEKRVLMVQL